MEEDIQPVAQALLNAILAQRFKADKSILEDLISKAESIDLTGYTAESVAVFQKALSEAQAVMANADLTEDDQATVNAAVAALSDAMNGLTAGGAPETTDKPEASQAPEATDKPQSTDKPQTTQKPEGLEAHPEVIAPSAPPVFRPSGRGWGDFFAFPTLNFTWALRQRDSRRILFVFIMCSAFPEETEKTVGIITAFPYLLK